MRPETKIRIKQNLIAYGFLAIPLMLLTVFTFYPLIQGIYVSFMRYEILKRPHVGSIVEFLKYFFSNLDQLSNPLLSLIIFIISIGFIVTIIFKTVRMPKKIILVFLAMLLVINIIPAAGLIDRTLKEINYVINEERVLKTVQAEKYEKMLIKKYAGKDVTIIREQAGEDKVKITVKESIWIGLSNYQRILRNQEFGEFVKNTLWYQLFIGLIIIELISLYYVRKKMDNNRLKTVLTWSSVLTIALFLTLTWPKLFHDRVWLFYEGLENSLKYLLVVIPIQFCSILLAVLVNQKIKGMKFFRTLYYIPVITGIVIVGYCWKWVFNPDGLLNALLQMAGILQQGQKIYWLSDPKIALWVVMFVTLWRGLGYYMVIYMAGLQNIPNDIIEAAIIDGANKPQLIRKIYLPLLRPTIFLCTTMSTMAALKIFEELFVLTSGAANTTTLVYLIYDKAFGGTEFKFGYSSAIAVILSIIIGFFTVLNFKANKQGDQYA